MGNLVMPKNSAEANEMLAVLKVYSEASSWLDNKSFIDKMKTILGEPYQEPQAYTKKTQITSYFGFTTWEDLSNNQSKRSITESGKRFYAALVKNDTSEIIHELIQSLKKQTFGRNVCGVSSDSDIEPPQLFIRCAIVLGYLTRKEFGYILWYLDEFKEDLFDLISTIASNRFKQINNFNNIPPKYADAKPITALINWGFLVKDDKIDGQDKIKLNTIVTDSFLNELQNLKVFNTDKSLNIFTDEEHDSTVLAQNTIYYGAPGTGKSHKVDTIIEELETKYYERVTFHPEFDNSSFIGGYKPISVKVKYDEGDNEYFENEVHYKFVPQAFTNIYERAWLDLENQYYLVIEEINRGNCAEIFGEIFQLLDRTSNYTVSPSKELKEYLIDEAFEDKNHAGIANGLKLPPNLSILATMNTSDQSLFPMDSAFKRRWDWEYVPICYDAKDELGNDNDSFDFEIDIEDGNKYSWIKFIEKVNLNHIKNNPSLGMDKCIGNYFIKPEKDNTIALKPFINKVIFYLWNDVFKDEDNNVFEQNTSYEDFFPMNTNGKEKIKALFERIELLPKKSLEINEEDIPLGQVAEPQQELELE
ncbi:McrB family protein [Flavobacterium adhaerens]|uniref:McrB family protein n=1 Tax=Flavobacterium adhaerens TaxID=3149043 RepID=UPI0032B4D409